MQKLQLCFSSQAVTTSDNFDSDFGFISIVLVYAFKNRQTRFLL